MVLKRNTVINRTLKKLTQVKTAHVLGPIEPHKRNACNQKVLHTILERLLNGQTIREILNSYDKDRSDAGANVVSTTGEGLNWSVFPKIETIIRQINESELNTNTKASLIKLIELRKNEFKLSKNTKPKKIKSKQRMNTRKAREIADKILNVKRKPGVTKEQLTLSRLVFIEFLKNPDPVKLSKIYPLLREQSKLGKIKDNITGIKSALMGLANLLVNNIEYEQLRKDLFEVEEKIK